MKNKFRIVGIIAGLFSLCNFSSAGIYTITGTGTPLMSVPLNSFPASSCNVTVSCTLSSSSTAYVKFASSYHAKVGNSWYSYNSSALNSSPLTVPGGSSVDFTYDLGSVTIPSDYGGVCYGVSLFRTHTCQNCTSLEWSCTFSGESILSAGGSSSCPECPTCQSCSPFSGKLDLYYSDDGEYINATIFGGKYSVYLPTGFNWVGFEDGDSYGINISSNVPVCTGDSGNDLSGVNWSLLYINDIQHIGAGIINITIPEEFDWDYLYTGNGDQFDLNISGYNVDSAYIDGIITTQKTLPNVVDFNNIVSVLIPKLIPGLVIILFLLFVFRFVKKIF